MPAVRSKKSPSTAEVSPMEKAATAGKPRKRTARPKAKPKTPVVTEQIPESPTARRPRRIVFWALLAVLPVVALAGLLLVRGDDSGEPISPGAPAAVSPDELASFASSREAPIYWAGGVPGRKIELRTTRAGTFVRYLPPSARAGDSGTALTIATYPLRNAYATASRRAGGPRMARRDLAAGGIAVWSQAKPTSIYLAFQGVPHLVEVYAPTRAEARRFALSGRVRPVS
jgi:hypothetical protein